MFGIKGAPCTAPSVHDFDAGCTILKAVHPACVPHCLIFSVYFSLCAFELNSWCTHFAPSAPGGCTNLNLNFEHWHHKPPMSDRCREMSDTKPLDLGHNVRHVKEFFRNTAEGSVDMSAQ